MGIPYSREINAAFEQVTPLVAAGFQVLQTTRNISILLAAIQVLTVLLLALVLLFLVLIAYAVNPDLEDERKALVTPFLKWLAHISLGQVLRAAASVLLGGAIFAGGVGRLVFWRGVEREGAEDADRALEEMEGDGKEKGKDKKSGKDKKDEKKKKGGEKDGEDKRGK